jgi:hypothetical protein
MIGPWTTKIIEGLVLIADNCRKEYALARWSMAAMASVVTQTELAKGPE